MTGHQIDNFVGSLVEMAKAFEERPKLEQEITNLNNKISDISLDNSALRGSNDILRGHIETLTAKVAEVTKERDDAGFRCLEADDKAARVLDLARTLASGLGQVIAEVEPPKPQEPVVEQPKTEPDPYNNPEDRHPMFPEQGYYSPPQSREGEQASAHDAGQSDPHPTQAGPSEVLTAMPTTEASSTTTQSETVGETPSANSSNDKPYAGKRYTELPAWDRPSNFTAWEAGGGDWQGWIS